MDFEVKSPHFSKQANRFAILSSEEDDDDDEEQGIPDGEPGPAATKTPDKPKPTPRTFKPPPIFIPDVTNIKALTNSIAGVLGNDVEFTLQMTSNNNVRVMTPDKESFSALKDFLTKSNNRFQTFQPRDESAYRVVIKGLHYSTDPEEIRDGLNRHAHKLASAPRAHYTVSSSKVTPNVSFANAAKQATDETHAIPQTQANIDNLMETIIGRMEAMFEKMMEKAMSETNQMMEKVMSQMNQMMATVCKSLCKQH
ncbi:GD11961 [Drosophila simulans]|uniref:GD11961 n=1 Tax=Drosophila simulans TaxID=7240 RepID=B4NS09_DROSI|nr:GD11961 [Drosophila simulans]